MGVFGVNMCVLNGLFVFVEDLVCQGEIFLEYDIYFEDLCFFCVFERNYVVLEVFCIDEELEFFFGIGGWKFEFFFVVGVLGSIVMGRVVFWFFYQRNVGYEWYVCFGFDLVVYDQIVMEFEDERICGWQFMMFGGSNEFFGFDEDMVNVGCQVVECELFFGVVFCCGVFFEDFGLSEVLVDVDFGVGDWCIFFVEYLFGEFKFVVQGEGVEILIQVVCDFEGFLQLSKVVVVEEDVVVIWCECVNVECIVGVGD